MDSKWFGNTVGRDCAQGLLGKSSALILLLVPECGECCTVGRHGFAGLFGLVAVQGLTLTSEYWEPILLSADGGLAHNRQCLMLTEMYKKQMICTDTILGRIVGLQQTQHRTSLLHVWTKQQEGSVCMEYVYR